MILSCKALYRDTSTYCIPYDTLIHSLQGVDGQYVSKTTNTAAYTKIEPAGEHQMQNKGKYSTMKQVLHRKGNITKQQYDEVLRSDNHPECCPGTKQGENNQGKRGKRENARMPANAAVYQGSSQTSLPACQIRMQRNEGDLKWIDICCRKRLLVSYLKYGVWEYRAQVDCVRSTTRCGKRRLPALRSLGSKIWRHTRGWAFASRRSKESMGDDTRA